MKLKKLQRRETATKKHMVGDWFKVSQLMPGYCREMSADTSPFLMLDYNAPWEVRPNLYHTPGVGYHPHRGFETVTIVYSGEIEHNDTVWNAGKLWVDEVQWMTAWSGLFHNEYMGQNFIKNWWVQHLVQIWIDLPKAQKMSKPKYQTLTRANIPELTLDFWKVRVIAGEFEWVKGIADTFSPILLADMRFENSWQYTLEVSEGWNLMLLTVEGSAQYNDEVFTEGSLGYFSQEGQSVTISAEKWTKVLIMAWEPLWQDVYNYWPFVMSSPQELMQAFTDLNSGAFWPMPSDY